MSAHDRRTFLTTIGGLAAFSSAAGAQPPTQPGAGGPLDISWFDRF